MAYTPPAGGALNVIELSSVAAYTPPASTPVVVDLAAEEGATGTVEFVTSVGALSLVGFVPSKAVISHVIPSTTAALNVAGYVPSYTTTRTSIQSAAGALTLTGYAPTTTTTQVSTISAAGALTLAAYQFTQFKGITQTIAVIGGLTLAGNAGITQARVSSNAVVAGSLTLSADQITQSVAAPLGQYATLALAVDPSITQTQRIRCEIDSRYFTPDITISEEGVLTLTPYPAIGQHRLIRGESTLIYGLTHILPVGFVGLYTERSAFGFSGTYDIRSRIVQGATSLYSIKATNRIVASVEGKYRLPIATSVLSQYSMVISTRVRASVTSPYSSLTNTRIRTDIYSSYLTRYLVRSGPIAKYSMTTPANKGIVSSYDIQSVMKVHTSVAGIYSAIDAQVISITEAPYLEYYGVRLGISEAELSIAEGDYAWKASVVLTQVTDYAKLKQAEPFAIVIGVERYEFIVDSKELDRSNPANYSMKLLGISPSAKFSAPRHISSSYLWDTFVQASAVASELLPGIDWQIVDWGIPAYRLAVQDSTPVETVQLIAAAVGATLETNIDGSLYVRSLFPISVPDYAGATPEHILLEDTDILRVSESYVSIDVFNRLIITDISTDISDSLEWIPDYTDATTGVMRAFLYPWRSAVSLLHTGLPAIFIGAPSVGMEQHTEILEVFQGSGDAGYPIHHVESVEYEAQNVGALVFDVDSRSFTVGGPSFNSVIRLVYWTRSLDYRVSLPTTRPTQFLLESEPL